MLRTVSPRLYARDVEVVTSWELQAMFEVASRARVRSRYIVDTTIAAPSTTSTENGNGNNGNSGNGSESGNESSGPNIIGNINTNWNSRVQGRIEINPALAMGLNRDIYLGVRTVDAYVEGFTEFISRYLSGQFRVVRLAHEGDFGMPVQITANVNLSDMDTRNLSFLSYNREENVLIPLLTPNSSVDSGGYLHFTTIYGGYIIVSDGPMTRR